MAPPDPRDLAPADLHTGLTAAFEREISTEDVAAFAALSGDHNPLHLDPAYAAGTNFRQPIVHGAFQIALASALLGMHLPGKRVLLGSTRTRFPAPLYYPGRVEVRGEVISWFASSGSGMLRVEIRDAASRVLTAEVHLGFALHEARAGTGPTVGLGTGAPAAAGRTLVIMTGAGGAVGRALCDSLRPRFDLLPLLRAGAPPEEGALPCDLEEGDWETELAAALGGRSVHALIHAAWPPAVKGGLLELDPGALRRQLDFGGLLTVRLARWLMAHGSAGARMVVLGSTAGTRNPELGLAGYSLGKATLEHVVRLLAPELARKRITINAILPSYMPVGMNRVNPERTALLEAAKVPLGRLCTIEDVAAAVDYLLSPGAAFLTGQTLALTGGRL